MSVRAVLGKELLDHSRDRRSLLSAFLFPVFGPVLFAVMMRLLAGWLDSGTPPHLAVEGSERAPNLVRFLEGYGVKVEPAPQDYEARIKDGSFDAALVITEEFGDHWSTGRPADVQLVTDRSRKAAASQVNRIRRILETYSGMITSQRLLARGVAPELARTLNIDEVDLATPEKLAATLLDMIPIFLVLGAFMGGMNVAIDATAGERERGSLEPLLINPVGRGAIVVGKWLTTVIMASIAITLTALGFLVAMKQVPLEVLGVKASLGGVELLAILAAVLPLTLFASAVQMLVATFARSFKEAQTYLSLLVILPTVPGLALTFAPVEPTVPMHLVPMLGQHLLVSRILSGEGLSLAAWFCSLAGVCLPTAVCLVLCTRLLSKEQIVFGR